MFLRLISSFQHTAALSRLVVGLVHQLVVFLSEHVLVLGVEEFLISLGGLRRIVLHFALFVPLSGHLL